LLDWPLTPLGELVLVLKYTETAGASTEDNTSPRKYYNWPLTPLGELVLVNVLLIEQLAADAARRTGIDAGASAKRKAHT
jgi:hypothetical protein